MNINTDFEVTADDLRPSYIYKITNTINGKSYIGKTVRPKERWKAHQWEADRGTKRPLYNSIRKHGITSFTFEIIAECLAMYDSALEQLYIVQYHSRETENGYNLTDGGEGLIGAVLTEEHRRKIGEANEGRIATPETRSKLRECNRRRLKHISYKESLNIFLFDRDGLDECEYRCGERIYENGLCEHHYRYEREFIEDRFFECKNRIDV